MNAYRVSRVSLITVKTDGQYEYETACNRSTFHLEHPWNDVADGNHKHRTEDRYVDHFDSLKNSKNSWELMVTLFIGVSSRQMP